MSFYQLSNTIAEFLTPRLENDRITSNRVPCPHFACPFYHLSFPFNSPSRLSLKFPNRSFHMQFERDLTGSQVPKNELHRPYEARNKEFNNFPASRSGSMAQIILPFPFPYSAATGCINFTPQRRHKTSCFIGFIKRHTLSLAFNFALYREH